MSLLGSGLANMSLSMTREMSAVGYMILLRLESGQAYRSSPMTRGMYAYMSELSHDLRIV